MPAKPWIPLSSSGKGPRRAGSRSPGARGANAERRWLELEDDPNLLRHAAKARDVGRNPRIVGYSSEFGPSASYYAWIAAGRPVHGVREQ